MSHEPTRDDTCDRCGQDLGDREGFCDPCLEWIRSHAELTDEEVAETVLFGPAPVSSPDRIVFLMVRCGGARG